MKLRFSSLVPLVVLLASISAVAADELPYTPDLRPMTLAEAQALIPWVRQMHVESVDGNTPVAWSALDAYVDSRTWASEYAIASSVPVPFGEPITMYYVEAADRPAYEIELEQMLETAAYDVATIQLAGPIIFAQRFLLPDGQIFPETLGARPTYAFAYRAIEASLIHVEGELRVVEPAMGDEPLAIDDWIGNLVDPSTPCVWGDYEAYRDAWVFWLSVFLNYTVTQTPKDLCVYTFTPAFDSDLEEPIGIDAVADAPSSLGAQFVRLKSLFVDEGFTLSDEQIAQVLTEFTPNTLDWWCANYYKLDYCKSTKGKKVH